jgi:hypothetical protein
MSPRRFAAKSTDASGRLPPHSNRAFDDRNPTDTESFIWGALQERPRRIALRLMSQMHVAVVAELVTEAAEAVGVPRADYSLEKE